MEIDRNHLDGHKITFPCPQRRERAPAFKLLDGICESYKISFYVQSKAVDIYNRYLNIHSTTDKIELIKCIIASLSIALKYYDTNSSFSYREICTKPSYGITAASLSMKEIDILDKLQWEIKDTSTASSFISLLYSVPANIIENEKKKEMIVSRLTVCLIKEFDRRYSSSGVSYGILSSSILLGIINVFGYSMEEILEHINIEGKDRSTVLHLTRSFVFPLIKKIQHGDKEKRKRASELSLVEQKHRP